MATVGLVSCVSRKLASAAEARSLYASTWFVKAREYVEAHCDTWFILSAKYGLVAPSAVIAPYEETLNEKSVAERRAWAERVWIQLIPHLHPGDRIVVLAGERYREFLLPRLVQHGCTVEVPMQGLRIGRQLQWLATELSRPARDHHLKNL